MLLDVGLDVGLLLDCCWMLWMSHLVLVVLGLACHLLLELEVGVQLQILLFVCMLLLGLTVHSSPCQYPFQGGPPLVAVLLLRVCS